LRGPDEAQHFLRAYGLAQGDLVPNTRDVNGRKGLFLPPHMHRDFTFFEAAASKGTEGNARELLKQYRSHKAAQSEATGAAAVFIPYGGAEGYSPVGYIPYTAGALLGRALGLDFVTVTYVMRLFGLLAFTAIAHYAIILLPSSGWALLAIAMLPAAFYARAVINADGAALVSTMVVTALCLRVSLGIKEGRGQRAVWFALCVLTKAPQLAFILLEGMVRPLRGPWRQWLTSACIVIPAVILALLWTSLSGADVAVWRLVELTGAPAEQFSPLWKLHFILDHPLHFPQLVLGTLPGLPEIWRQLIGVLGLFDTVLHPWAYPAISMLTVLACLSSVHMSDGTRLRVALVGLTTAAAYILTVFLIFYMVWTPITADQVWGVQGRYFLPALPVLAVVFGALIRRGLPQHWTASFAVAAALLSGFAAAEAVLRVDWKLFSN
jgi:uncharacterized membrane protein